MRLYPVLSDAERSEVMATMILSANALRFLQHAGKPVEVDCVIVTENVGDSEVAGGWFYIELEEGTVASLKQAAAKLGGGRFTLPVSIANAGLRR